MAKKEKKPKIPPEEIRRQEIERILKEVEKGVPPSAPEPLGASVFSREYQTFLAEERYREKPTLYERAARIAARLNIEPDQDMRKSMQEAIEFAHLDVTPTGAFSLAILSVVVLFLFTIVAFFLKFISLTGLLVMFLLILIDLYVFISYPVSAAKIFRVKAASEIILAIIYMVIYMRSSPNLEGAIRYAAINLTGPLAYDFRKLLWDVETGRYQSMEVALDVYLQRWKTNEEFIESISLIRNSMEQPESRRHAVLDEAVNVVLTGTREKMQKYSQGLRMPILLIHTMGIILPILVLVMFPVIILFLGKALNPWVLVAFYDLILPVTIYKLSKRILESRPVGFSVPDISLHPKFQPLGMVHLGEKLWPIWPFAIGLMFLLVVFTLALLAPHLYEISTTSLFLSLAVTWAVAAGLMVYFFTGTTRLLKIRNEIKRIQDEFGEALFRLGNTLSLGTPLEKAIEETVQKSPDLSISALFKKVLDNVRQGQLSFEAAFFDRKYGAVWDYPSKLIINVMHIIVEATKKGVRIAANSALAISRYIRQIHSIDEELRDMLSETTTSMRFMSAFLGPMIAGVTVTMAGVMMLIFKQLGASVASLQGTSIPGFSQLLIGGWGEAINAMPMTVFQLVVGIYLIEVIYLLSILAVGVESGPDDVVQMRNTAAWSLLVGMLVYTFSLVITWSIFGRSIASIISGGIV